MHLGIIALTFGVIFIAELPDKSLLASLILGNRYPSGYVWLGAASAFLVHVAIAVTAGHFLTLLPHRVLELIVGCLFLIGAALIFSGKHNIEEATHHQQEAPQIKDRGFWKVFATTFGIVFIGEWGDITQIVTANYAAKYHAPLSVAIGATLALWSVTGLAIIVGSKLLSLIPARTLQTITGLVMSGFGLASLITALN